MSQLYTIVPLPQGPFAALDPLARLCFGLIWDRYKISSYNVTGCAGDSPWYDSDEDEIYCAFAQGELAALMGVSERTVRRCLADLKAADVIWWRKAKYASSCRYYVDYSIRRYLRPQSGK